MAYGDIVQTKTDATADAEYPTSFSVTLDSTPVEGNLLVVFHFTGAANSTAPTGFSEAIALTDSGNADEGAIYYKIAGSSESTTITAGSSAGDEHALSVAEIEGAWNATPIDQTVTAGPTSTNSMSTGTTGTTSQNDEVAAAIITNRHTSSPTAWTNSFVERGNIASQFKSMACATLLLTSTGTQETTASGMTNNAPSLGGIATFKKSAAAAADILNRGLSNIEGGIIASSGGGHSGLHPIEEGFVS